VTPDAESPKVSTQIPAFAGPSSNKQYAQSTKIIPGQDGSTLDEWIVRVDSLYALSELLILAACS
jgi:hypothetical protein